MKRIWLAILLSCLLAQPVQAQDGTKLYLPLITKSGRCEPMTDPILRVTDGTTVIDLIGPGSGWELADPYWQPQIAQFKGGGAFVDSGLAEGKQLVHREYDNVIETIPLSVTGIDQGAAIQTIRDLLQLGRQASDYYTESYEYDDVWLEAKPACANSLTGYSRIIKMSIPNLNNIFGQPFFSAFEHAVMEDLTLTIEREPFWRGTPPGEIIGPLYNLIKNPDFELWNFGTGDSQPDSWTDLESLWITGQNSRDSISKWGNYDLKIRVSGSTKAGAIKGITQVIDYTNSNTEYTVLAWVRSDGVSNGVGRILINYSNQLELYRSSAAHGWTLYAEKITTNVGDIVSVNCEILTTAANTDGTVYFDGLMFIEGDWIEEAKSGTLPYLSSSNILNRWDVIPGTTITAGAINWVDVWNVPGDVDSLLRLELQNKGTEPIKKARIGMRRTNDVVLFDNFNNVLGTTDITGSSGDSKTTTALNSGWNNIITETIVGPLNTKNNIGRFRLLARVYDNRSGNTTLQVRARYFKGTSGINDKILDTIDIPVTQQWSLVDLTQTKAVIFDNKFNSEFPNQIGYSLEFKRTDNNSTGLKVDYIMMMPTDGGFIDANFYPLLITDAVFLVDNTNSKSVSVFQKPKTGWTLLLTTTEVDSLSTKTDVYNDYLFLSGYKVGSGAYFYKFKTGLGIVSKNGYFATAGSVYFAPKKVYNDVLYTLSDDTDLLRTDLVSLGLLGLDIPLPLMLPFLRSSMAIYGDYLYIITAVKAVPTVDTEIFRHDGTNYIKVALIPAFIHGSGSSLIVHNGKLYSPSPSTNKILEFDIASGMFNIYNVAYSPTCIALFNGSLYVTSSTSGIYYFNGVNWDTKVSTLSGGKLIIYNDKLYFSNTTETYHTINGTDWIYDIGLTGYTIDNVYDNKLISINSKSVYYAIISGADYQVENYSGRDFYSPPRERNNEKRHRFFVTLDRDGYINNINDLALLGIGFVPRYLSLINYYPQ